MSKSMCYTHYRTELLIWSNSFSFFYEFRYFLGHLVNADSLRKTKQMEIYTHFQKIWWEWLHIFSLLASIRGFKHNTWLKVWSLKLSHFNKRKKEKKRKEKLYEIDQAMWMTKPCEICYRAIMKHCYIENNCLRILKKCICSKIALQFTCSSNAV